LMTRPFESASVLVALAIAFSWERRNQARFALPWVLLGLLPFVAALLIHNASVTGCPWLAPWFLSPVERAVDFGPDPVFANAPWFQVLFYAVGPLGLPLIAWGVATDRRMRALAVALVFHWGFLWVAAGALRLDPVQSGEGSVPLLLIAVFGVTPALRWVSSTDWRGKGAPTLALALAVSLGGFNVAQIKAFHRQGAVHSVIHGLDEHLSGRAVLLVPPYTELVLTFPQFREDLGFPLQWPLPRPDWSDRLIIVPEAGTDLRALERALPGRKLLRLYRADSESGGTGIRILPAWVKWP
ncbi:MAG: hypothetical protein KDB61_13630, partial [Planctomycetes bacterium]|nr:hypothetical protein [Planctomycetota bacterium]